MIDIGFCLNKGMKTKVLPRKCDGNDILWSPELVVHPGRTRLIRSHISGAPSAQFTKLNEI
jgi:hypothetical protein